MSHCSNDNQHVVRVRVGVNSGDCHYKVAKNPSDLNRTNPPETVESFEPAVSPYYARQIANQRNREEALKSRPSVGLPTYDRPIWYG